mmetsp:Transcript_12609/g.35705  ORF Transcript_12609/g.35705 Transcript_12609/m.35705 type:complete len:287 (+) Transcript_12609:403-1263(+)
MGQIHCPAAPPPHLAETLKGDPELLVAVLAATLAVQLRAHLPDVLDDGGGPADVHVDVLPVPHHADVPQLRLPVGPAEEHGHERARALRVGDARGRGWRPRRPRPPPEERPGVPAVMGPYRVLARQKLYLVRPYRHCRGRRRVARVARVAGVVRLQAGEAADPYRVELALVGPAPGKPWTGHVSDIRPRCLELNLQGLERLPVDLALPPDRLAEYERGAVLRRWLHLCAVEVEEYLFACGAMRVNLFEQLERKKELVRGSCEPVEVRLFERQVLGSIGVGEEREDG